MKKFIFLGIFAILIAGWIVLFWLPQSNIEINDILPSSPRTEHEKALITIASTTIAVEIADTEEKRQKGLGGRAFLGENEGMLFVFPESSTYGFWMKDMQFALDFIWIDEHFSIADITENISPDTFPEIFTPALPVRYILELSAGFVRKNNLQKGSAVVIRKKI